MELTIKHLAAYLPYGLVLYGASDLWEIDILGKENICIKNAVHKQIISLEDLKCNYSPILRPLSKLKNDELIPIGLIIRNIDTLNATKNDKIFAIEDAKAWIRNGMKPVLSLKQVCEVMEHLYSSHADIFGLIDAGLAVEMEG